MSPAFVRKGVTKIRRWCAFVSYASTFLHLQPRLTQFFAFFFANQTSFQDEFLPKAFFIDDQFFRHLKLRF
jgi:hypothetical protein